MTDVDSPVPDPSNPATGEPPSRRVGLAPGTMTDEHKARLRQGREEGQIVRNYLKAIAKRPRGRPRSRDSIQRRLMTIAEKFASADPLLQLELTQERIDLQQELERIDNPVDISELEAQFKNVALSYSQRKGIKYAAWREMGVPATVLKEAGVEE